MCVLLGIFPEFPVDPYYEPLAWFMIRVGVAYMNVRILRCLKEELCRAIDKWLRPIINTMLFKTVIPLRI